MHGVIYLLLNIKSNDVYIGQTTNFKNRMSKYKTLNCKGQPKLYNSLIKNGFDSFKIYVLQHCDSKQELDEYEKYYIDLYKSNIYGYNCSEGGENTTKGHKFKRPARTIEHKEKLSKIHIGKCYRGSGFLVSNETKEKSKISNQYRSKPILCIDTQIVYHSISEASRELNLQKAQLQRHLQKKPHHLSVGGLTFEYQRESPVSASTFVIK